jgi:cation diffusion facilitator CzcD-associated flavoprotein CzcO
MTRARRQDVAIVGGGPVGLVGYVTLVHGGVDRERIAVYSDGADPASPWRERAAAIRQRVMRSESDGHCLATSFPGLAFRAALRERRAGPLWDSWRDRFHPTVDDFLADVERARARSGWDERLVRRRVQRIGAGDGGFTLDGEGPFAHVLLAPGHPGLNVPEELRSDPRTVHAYQPHDYASEVAVVGAGMAAATEWLNALAAGASVVSIRRREPVRRPLNVPRPLFTRRGLRGYHALSPAERAARLKALLAPSYPPGMAFDGPLQQAEREGRFRIADDVNGARQVICATGFRKGYAEDPLLRELVAEHGLQTEERWLVLAPDCAVPGLTDRTRTLSVAGVQAQWAFPGADTLVGGKYAARGLLRRIAA